MVAGYKSNTDTTGGLRLVFPFFCPVAAALCSGCHLSVWFQIVLRCDMWPVWQSILSTAWLPEKMTTGRSPKFKIVAPRPRHVTIWPFGQYSSNCLLPEYWVVMLWRRWSPHHKNLQVDYSILELEWSSDQFGVCLVTGQSRVWSVSVNESDWRNFEKTNTNETQRLHDITKHSMSQTQTTTSQATYRRITLTVIQTLPKLWVNKKAPKKTQFGSLAKT